MLSRLLWPERLHGDGQRLVDRRADHELIRCVLVQESAHTLGDLLLSADQGDTLQGIELIADLVRPGWSSGATGGRRRPGRP